ncbi:MAG: DUF1905 domain-containing protein [Terriglobales bacterium]
MPKSTIQKFKARLEGVGPGQAWTFLTVPFDVEKVYGTRARLAVRGTLNGFAFRSSIMPMDGSHCMMVNKQMQQGAGARAGDTVQVVMQPDTAPRVVKPPADLKQALARNKAAREFFGALAYSHRKQYVDFLSAAKKPETRARRVQKTVALLAAGKKEM